MKRRDLWCALLAALIPGCKFGGAATAGIHTYPVASQLWKARYRPADPPVWYLHGDDLEVH